MSILLREDALALTAGILAISATIGWAWILIEAVETVAAPPSAIITRRRRIRLGLTCALCAGAFATSFALKQASEGERGHRSSKIAGDGARS
jgi:hypothetical protein